MPSQVYNRLEVITGGSTFKDVIATAAGNTAVWAPASGKRFRLRRFCYALTGNASQSVAGTLNVHLRDAGTPIPGSQASLYVPGAAGTTLGAVYTPWIALDDGFLSAAINQSLNVNLQAALATGSLVVIVAGQEE